MGRRRTPGSAHGKCIQGKHNTARDSTAFWKRHPTPFLSTVEGILSGIVIVKGNTDEMVTGSLGERQGKLLATLQGP